MRIAVVTDSTFWEKTQGAHQRIFRLLEYLNDISELCILYLGFEEDTERIQSVFSKPPAVIPIRKKAGFLCRLKKYVQRKRHQAEGEANGPPLTNFVFDVSRRDVTETLVAFAPQVVLVEYITCAFVKSASAQHQLEHTRWILDTIDVFSQRCLSFKAQGLPHWVYVTAKQERDVLNSFDAVLAISREDAKSFEEIGVTAPVLYCPHPAIIEPSPDEKGPRKEKGFRIGYLSGRGVANLHGLKWFLEEVWPMVSESVEQVSFHIAGAICQEVDMNREDVTLHGKVEEGTGFLQSCDMVINPVFAGGGLKIKCVEALSAGVPLLTTPTGAEGLVDGIGEAFLCAETPETFCRAIQKLSTDEDVRKGFARRGVTYVQATLGPEMTYRALREYLHEVCPDA